VYIVNSEKKFSVAIVEVLILQRFPYGKDSTFFYYAFPETLRVSAGDLVEVPWRKSKKQGLVVKTKIVALDSRPFQNWQVDLKLWVKKSNYFFSRIPPKSINLKPITEIVAEGYLNPDLLVRLGKAAREYFVSWNHFAKAVVNVPTTKNKVRRSVRLPSRNNRNAKRYSYLAALKEWTNHYNEAKSCFAFQKNKKKDILLNKKVPFIFLAYEQKDALEILIKKTLEEKKQVLVIVPEKAQLIPVAGKYSSITNSFSLATPICLGKLLTDKLLKNAWQLTRNSSPLLFIGTRSALFAPFSNLGMVILEEGHDESYKQWDLSPLYDTRKLLTTFYPNVLKIYLSSTPRLQDFYNSPFFLAKSKSHFYLKSLDLISLENKKVKIPAPIPGEKSPRIFSRTIRFENSEKKVTLINLNTERFILSEMSPISDYLRKNLISELKKGNWLLLLANHRGIANFVMCQDCGFIPRCPHCGKALAYQNKLSFSCKFCGFTQRSIAQCPQCSGLKFNFTNFGTEKITEILEKLRGELDFSLIISSDPNPSAAALYSLSKELISCKDGPGIFLGFSGILPIGKILADRIGLAAILSVDNGLFYPDYRAEERAAARFYNLLSLTKKIYLQTSDPLQPFLQKIIRHPYSSLYSDWIRERKKYHYPPFSKIIRIEIPTLRDIPGETRAKKMIERLKGDIRVIEATFSQLPESDNKRNKYAAIVMVKLKNNTDSNAVLDGLFREFGQLKIDPD